MTEFDIIKNFFTKQTVKRNDVICGIGDDAAIVQVPAEHNLVVTTDTTSSGIHFPETALPFDIGYKSLAVNLSDLATMGAIPAWFTLALSLPNADATWLTSFTEGLFSLSHEYQINLIGGDLTHGPLSITITAMGFLPSKKALLRSGAKPGDLIYVSGTLGDAGLALQTIKGNYKIAKQHLSYLLLRLNRPEPRVLLGQKLLAIAHAAIDISDGLAADLNHILTASNVGAKINVDKIPLSDVMQQSVAAKTAYEFALTAGDDYELCFTIPADKQQEIEKISAIFSLPLTCIGEITTNKKLDLYYQNGNKYDGQTTGYQHF